jgi:hypothetical protein
MVSPLKIIMADGNRSPFINNIKWPVQTCIALIILLDLTISVILSAITLLFLSIISSEFTNWIPKNSFIAFSILFGCLWFLAYIYNDLTIRSELNLGLFT